MSKKAIIFAADGTEDIELVATADVLRRSGIEVTIASIMDKTEIECSNNTRLVADCLANDADFDNADVVILPGGSKGTELLSEDGLVAIQCRQFVRHEKLVAAICAAPKILGFLGLLDGRRATCYPGCEEGLGEAVYTAAPVEIDGNLITANGPGTSLAFALAIVEELVGSDVAVEVAKNMQIVL